MNVTASVIARLKYSLLVLPLFSLSAHAAVLFDTGPDANLDGTALSDTANLVAVTDTFSLGAGGTVTSITFSNWLSLAIGKPSTIDWTITSAPFGGTTWGHGTSAVTLGPLYTGGPFLPRADATFNVPPLTLAAGTYWLELGKEQFSNDAEGYWGLRSRATGLAFILINLPAGPAQQGAFRNAFQITGTAAVPEPAASVLMALGLGVLTLGRWSRKLRQR